MTKLRILGLIFLFLLAGFTLAACNAVDIPLSMTNNKSGGSLAESQPAVSQNFNFDTQKTSTDWDAATFFAASCASCHGPTGQGTAVGPALNREEIRTAETNWLIETISYGRAGTAMPAWSVESGGSLTSDQIAELAAFLQAGSWDSAGELAAEQPAVPMGPGMMGRNRGNGMMGGGMMGDGMGNGRRP